MSEANEQSQPDRTHAITQSFDFLRRAALWVFAAIVLVLAIWVFVQVLPFTQVARFWGAETQVPRVWNLQASEVVDLTDTQLQAWGAIIQLVSALALAFALFFTARSVQLTQEQLKHNRAAQEQAQREFQATLTYQNEQLELARKAQADAQLEFQKTVEYQSAQLALGQRGQVTDRFTRATDQLGSDSLMTRLGGIRSLERIAHESPDDYWSVWQILAAYVREHARILSEPDDPPSSQPIAVDIKTVLAAIGYRVQEGENRGPERIDLHATDLRDVDLPGAFLAGANLSRARLRAAILRSANLRQADLTSVDLRMADLAGANLADADLRFADLRGANLQGADLRGTDLRGEARLGGANLSHAYLTETNLFAANLRGADLSNAFLDRANLDSALLDRVNLDRASIVASSFLNCDELLQAQINQSYMDEATALPDGRRRSRRKIPR